MQLCCCSILNWRDLQSYSGAAALPCSRSLIRLEIELQEKSLLKVPILRWWLTSCVLSLQVNSVPVPLASSAGNKTAHTRLNVISRMQISSHFCILNFSQRVNSASANIASCGSSGDPRWCGENMASTWREGGQSEDSANTPTITFGKGANCGSFTPFGRLQLDTRGGRNAAFKFSSCAHLVLSALNIVGNKTLGINSRRILCLFKKHF